jgi:2,4-dienoyl-CoA reductase-like NADH-dependent reductase (Old Yellow Enzyme family)
MHSFPIPPPPLQMSRPGITVAGDERMRLAEPFTLPSGISFKNRICKAAMTEGLAERDGHPNAGHVRLYERWARGGSGLLLTGNVQVDRLHLERPGNVVVDGPLGADAKEAWARWATASSLDGAKTWVQISHAGRQTQVTINKTPKAPSAVQLSLPGGMFGVPVPITEPEILDLVARFAHVAVVAKEAGFAGVQIHAAHGYLISQFLSPLANRRTDQWGGTLANRARFLLAIVDAVRAAVGPDFGLGVKLNSADFQKGGFVFEDSLIVAGWLQDKGIDLLEISGGTYEQPAMIGAAGMQPIDRPQQASTAAREAYFVDLAKALMGGKTPPLLVTGGFRSRAAMDQALASGIAMVGIGRPLCAAPDSSNDLLSGRIDELPRFENQLRIGPGPLGPHSSFKIARAINSFAAQAWYYQQLRCLAAGQPLKLGMNPLIAFIAEQRDAKTRS